MDENINCRAAGGVVGGDRAENPAGGDGDDGSAWADGDDGSRGSSRRACGGDAEVLVVHRDAAATGDADGGAFGHTQSQDEWNSRAHGNLEVN